MTRFTLSPAMAWTKSYDGNITDVTLILPFVFLDSIRWHPPEKIANEKIKIHAGNINKRFIVSPLNKNINCIDRVSILTFWRYSGVKTDF